MDTAKKTVTVAGRHGGTGTTLTLAPDAMIFVTRATTAADIIAGDRIDAYGAATPTAPDRTSDLLVILPAASTPAAQAGKRAGFHRNHVEGVVAAASPALTLTTEGGVKVTVTPAPGAQVTRLGTVADVTVGVNVQARTSGTADAPTATELRVLPARDGRRHGADTPPRNAAPAK